MIIKNKFFLFLLYCNQLIFSQINPAVSSTQMVANLGTGINLGNILSAPIEGNWASPLTEDYIDNIERLKFKHVRIPIRFDNQTTPISNVTYTDGLGNYIGSPSNYAVNISYLNRIEEIINWCIDRNLIAIIDVHGDHWFWESFDSTSSYYATGNDRLARIDRFKAIWRDISVRFQNKPNGKLLFEIMNEPFFSMSATEVNSINSQILSVIRNTNPSRCVIVTGGGQNSFEAPMQLSDSFLQSDNFLIATFHYYRPRAFTSSASQFETDNDWGTITDQTQVQSEFDQVYYWSTQKNIPIYLGEFGADNVNGYNYFAQTNGLYGGPDEYSRKFYHQFISNYARSKGFALSVWDSGEKSGKTIYLNSPKSWVKDIRNAVLGSNCTSNFLINNADIECNYDYNWNIQNNNSSIANINNATISNSYQNSNSLEIKVDTSTGVFGDVILLNEQITTGFTIGANYDVSCFAKGNNNQQFKFRIKCIIGGSTNFITSPAFQLSSSFLQFNYSFIIPNNTTEIQFQILCGEDLGSYFFDTFNVTEALSSQDFDNSKIIYPNPSNGNEEFYLKGFLDGDVFVYNLLGQRIPVSIKKLENSILVKPLQNLNNGIYLVNIISETKKQQLKWIIKK